MRVEGLSATLAPLLLAVTVSWHMPTGSQGCPQCPAGVKVLQSYLANCTPGRPYYNVYRPFLRFTYRRAGMADGHFYQVGLPSFKISPGDSFAFRVAIYDSAGNFPPDAETRGRAR